MSLRVLRTMLTVVGFGLICGSGFAEAPLVVPNADGFARLPGTTHDILQGPQNRPHAETYYLIALSQARKGNVQLALGTISRGMKLEPGNLHLMNLRAALLARSGHTLDAIAEFERVLALNPDDKYARESLWQLVPTRNAGRTRTTPSRVASVGPDSPVTLPTKPASGTSEIAGAVPPARVLEATYFTGMKAKQKCYFALSALKRARGALDKEKGGREAKAEALPAKDVVGKGGEKAGGKGKEEKDELDLQSLVSAKLLPSVPVCSESGMYSWKGGEPNCSVHGPLSQVEVQVKSVFEGFNRGLTAKMTQNLQEAKKSFEQVVVLYPRWGEAYYQLADTLFRLGEEASALEKVKMCVKIEPGNVDAKLLMANIYFKTGHREAALNILNQVAKSSQGTVYGLAARSLANAIRSGKNYYQIFPP